MISIAEAISDLLYVRDTVVVPGLGAFVKKPVSAQVNPVANYFAKPTSELAFDANLREDNELVVNYLSEKNDIPEEEARKLLSMFVSDCFNSLKQGKKVELNQIGTLSYDWANDLVFEQDKIANYNSDAFGLCDFTSQPVLRMKTKEEIKTEIEQNQKDKNTPITVDEQKRSLGWLWILLGVLIVAGTAFGLYHFKVVIFPWQQEERPVVTEHKTYTLPSYTKTWEWKEPVSQDTTLVPQDTAKVTVETVKQPAPTQTEANIRIIAGCFAVEENAVKLTNILKEKGYAGALYEKRSNMWYVSFGRYATDEEAAEALREIRANTEYKAWILK